MWFDSLQTRESPIATKLKVIAEHADIVSAPTPNFQTAPTRKRHAGWTAERQRRFIEQLALTGSVGEACAAVAAASSSAYRLRSKAAQKASLAHGMRRSAFRRRGSPPSRSIAR
jgi:hypothetical protein